MVRRAVALVLVCLAGTVGRAHGDAGDEERAVKLREDSTLDWKAGRHKEAAEKLRRAAQIYERAPEAHEGDLAIVWRAIVWNLVEGGDAGSAREPFERLVDLAQRAPAFEGELWNAYGALYQAAKGRSDQAQAEAFLLPVRAKAQAAKSEALAAQVLHDLGSIARDHGLVEQAAVHYERAIDERRAAGDSLRLCWSLNNLANLQLGQGKHAAALPRLLEAQRLVESARLLPPQAAVAENVRSALARIDVEDAPDEAERAWLWDLAETVAQGDLPEVLCSGSLLRRAARGAASSDKDADRLAAARRLAKAALSLAAQPVEVSADLTLIAARLASQAGGADDAKGWLEHLDVGTGPCAPNLSARLLLERARAAAARKDAAGVQREGAAAREALELLGDRALREGGLSDLIAACQAAGVEKLSKELAQELEVLQRQGVDGARGSRARGGGNREKADGLGLGEPLFEIRADGGRLLVRDLVADADMALDVRWQPLEAAVDGLRLTVFGGYVRIVDLDYGGAAVVHGATSTTTLETLDTYVPVPGRGALQVLKNGAVAYLADGVVASAPRDR